MKFTYKLLSLGLAIACLSGCNAANTEIASSSAAGMAGIAGVMVAILGTVIPPFLILSVLSVFYQTFRSNYVVSQMLEGMQAGVGAVIASVVFDMGKPIIKEKDILSILILAGAFLASYIWEVNVVFIILFCGMLGVCRTLSGKRRRKK
jgi:chromate transporter